MNERNHTHKLASRVLSVAMLGALIMALTSCAVSPGGGGAPNLSGSYSGSFTYGSGYASTAGQSVSFSVDIKQTSGSNHFTGVVREPYSGFGTAKNGSLWADITGTTVSTGSETRLSFVKTYRYFDQASINYQGTVPHGSSRLEGAWHFPTAPDQSGTFIIHNMLAK